MASVAQHQRQRADVRQRFLFLLLDRRRSLVLLRRPRRRTPFVPPAIAIITAFAFPLTVACVVSSGLLIIALLALLLHTYLRLIHCRVARRRVIISADSQQINYVRRSNRWRIASAAQWRADRCENSIACILVSQR